LQKRKKKSLGKWRKKKGKTEKGYELLVHAFMPDRGSQWIHSKVRRRRERGQGGLSTKKEHVKTATEKEGAVTQCDESLKASGDETLKWRGVKH